MSERDADRAEDIVETGDGTADAPDAAADPELGDDELAESAENEAELADDQGEDRDPGEDAEGGPEGEPDALVSRLRLIGEQPLPERAASLAQLHDELRARLEAGDAAGR